LARFADPVVHGSDCLSLVIILIRPILTFSHTRTPYTTMQSLMNGWMLLLKKALSLKVKTAGSNALNKKLMTVETKLFHPLGYFGTSGHQLVISSSARLESVFAAI
jgi:hypothetical protein